MASPAQAAPDPADQAFFQRASVCSAVLKHDVLQLKRRAEAGEPGLRAQMERLAEFSFSYVGTAYKRGLRKPQADELLDQAEAQQRSLGLAALRTLSADCQAEGDRLLNSANVLERALVRNRAKARVDQLLAKPAAGPARPA